MKKANLIPSSLAVLATLLVSQPATFAQSQSGPNNGYGDNNANSGRGQCGGGHHHHHGGGGRHRGQGHGGNGQGGAQNNSGQSQPNQG